MKLYFSELYNYRQMNPLFHLLSYARIIQLQADESIPHFPPPSSLPLLLDELGINFKKSKNHLLLLTYSSSPDKIQRFFFFKSLKLYAHCLFKFFLLKTNTGEKVNC